MKAYFFLRLNKPFVWVIFIHFFIHGLVLASITVEPNGVISHGTTLVIRITTPTGGSAGKLQIFKDENGDGRTDSNDTRVLENAPIDSSGNVDNLKVHFIEEGKFEIHLRITPFFEPGFYVIRFISDPGSPEGVVVKIVQRSSNIFSDLRDHLSKLQKMIKDPSPTLKMVRDIIDQNQINNADLWSMDAHRFKIKFRLTNTGDCLNPCLSPDGKRIAYVRWIDGNGQLWILSMKEGKPMPPPRRITIDNVESIVNPIWSCNGKKIAFLSGNRLMIANDDGSTPREILPLDGIHKILTWSSEDRYIFFSAKPTDKTAVLTKVDDDTALENLTGNLMIEPEVRDILDIWKVNIETRKRERFIYDIAWPWLDHVSPDGKKLVFPIKITATEYHLWLREGENFKEATRLMREKCLVIEPVWSPDGNWIVLVSDRDEKK